MKKLFLIVFILISVQSFSQFVQYPTNYGIGYRRIGGDTLLWCPIDTFSVPASLASKGHLARKGTTLYYWNGAAWAAFAGGGGGTYYNSNVGSAYRLAIPNTNNIKTLGANYGIILDSATSNQIGVKFDSATVFPQVRSWVNQQQFIDSFYSFASQKEYAIKDTVLFTYLPINTTTSGTRWKRNTLYSSNTTETVVAGGLQIANTYSGSVNSENTIADTTWESIAGYVTTDLSAKVTSIGGSNSFIGGVFYTACDFFASTVFGYINLNTSTIYLKTYTSTYTIGTLVNSISSGDSISFSFSENLNVYTFRITNHTKKKIESFSYEELNVVISPVTRYPALLVQNATLVTSKFHYYGHNYMPDFMFVGTSVTQALRQHTVGVRGTTIGILDSLVNYKLENAGKAASQITDMQSAIPEILRMKPRFVVLEAGVVEQAYGGSNPSVWGPKYRALVDTLLNHGIRVVVTKIIPTYVTGATVVNTWIDTTYSNNSRVQILNLFNTTDLYSVSNPPLYINLGASYYVDAGIHPSTKGCNEIAQYMKTQLERFFRNNFGSGADFTLTSRRDNQIPLYDSSGINQGAWSTYKLSQKFAIIGDSIDLDIPSGGVAADSVVVITSGGQLKQRNASAFGGLPTVGNQGEILQVSNGAAAWKYDTTTLVTFTAGARLAGDTTLFTDSTLYGSFYLDGNDTLIITKIRAVMNGGTSDTLGLKISFNDTINIDGTRIKTADIAVNSTTTGNETTSFDNSKIPPGNWVWMKTPIVVAGRKPQYLSVSIIGYKKRVN